MFKKLVTAILVATWSFPASALCMYRGVDNAKTTISQEYRDSRWVVRAYVVSADYHWSDEDESWTIYRLKVVKSYKGNLTSRFTLFTRRDSGGFYMDGNGGGPDLERDYLLFLTPQAFQTDQPAPAKGALWVNYNCGQSKIWNEITAREAAELASLSRHR